MKYVNNLSILRKKYKVTGGPIKQMIKIELDGEQVYKEWICGSISGITIWYRPITPLDEPKFKEEFLKREKLFNNMSNKVKETVCELINSEQSENLLMALSLIKNSSKELFNTYKEHPYLRNEYEILSKEIE